MEKLTIIHVLSRYEQWKKHLHTFLIWNLIVALVSSILETRESPCTIGAGNLPALLRPGPKTLGI